MADSLPSHIQLEIVTPDRQVVHDLVESVTIPGKGGYLGILPGHAPLLSELRTGEVVYSRDGTKHYLAVSWGFAEVLPSRVIILVQTAERAEEIDLARAARALERAEERLKEFTDPTIDAERAREAYQRALARLQAARRSGS
ncbi:MAG: F0F1 ATP synthase subunit epsilon [Acidobacteriia bacterium]|nr:F0F1 ATP synthase subunit epsilon [Terriglobia bacterium]